jgi:LuxR family transcriptional regulator, quorum-sensing system regulator BjaR1
MPESREDFGNRVLDFVDEIRDAVDHAEICRRMSLEVARIGYCYVSVWDFPRPGQSYTSGVLFNSRPPEYCERYEERHYAAIDPLIRAVRRTLAPVVWSDIPKGEISKEAKLLFHDARDTGANNGIVVPIVSASGSISIFSASGYKPDVSPRARSAVEIVGIYSRQLLQRTAKAAADVPAPRPILTRREREIMTWIAAGKTDEEISCILHIRRETVTTHVNNAKLKLNATRRTQAVVQALRLGEIAL